METYILPKEIVLRVEVVQCIGAGVIVRPHVFDDEGLTMYFFTAEREINGDETYYNSCEYSPGAYIRVVTSTMN